MHTWPYTDIIYNFSSDDEILKTVLLLVSHSEHVHICMYRDRRGILMIIIGPTAPDKTLIHTHLYTLVARQSDFDNYISRLT